MSEKQVIKKEDVGTIKTEDISEPEPEPEFTLKPVAEKPSRRYRKGSKYDPILDAFIKGKDKLVTVSVEGKEANYLRTQIDKRIDARKLKKIKVTVTNNVCYLEKT